MSATANSGATPMQLRATLPFSLHEAVRQVPEGVPHSVTLRFSYEAATGTMGSPEWTADDDVDVEIALGDLAFRVLECGAAQRCAMRLGATRDRAMRLEMRLDLTDYDRALPCVAFVLHGE